MIVTARICASREIKLNTALCFILHYQIWLCCFTNRISVSMNDFKVNDYRPQGTFCEMDGGSTKEIDLADFNGDGR